MKTMICLVLDRSGSMQGREHDVTGGVNQFIDDQKKLPDPASMAFVRFDSGGVERFRPMMNLAEVEHLKAGDFQPRGGTPLLDAIGKTIIALEEDWKAEQPDRAIMVIVTDGQENESREYTKAKVKALIETRQASGLWAFIYLGANVDAFAEAGTMGFSTANTAGYRSTAMGTQSAYASVSKTVTAMRATGQTMDSTGSLGRDIPEDDVPLAPVAQPKPAWMKPASASTSSEAWKPPV